MITEENGDKVLSTESVTLPACLSAGLLEHINGFSYFHYVRLGNFHYDILFNCMMIRQYISTPAYEKKEG